jgi:hypothetical protein
MTKNHYPQPINDIVVNVQITLPMASIAAAVEQLAPIIASHLQTVWMQPVPAAAEEKPATIPNIPKFPEAPDRLAYSLRETANLLGVSYHSVLRLTKRGLLKYSGALRLKLISKQEIERFLKSTTI